MERDDRRQGQLGAPLVYFYCVCFACEGANPIVITFCATCANMCCYHLMYEFRCFECWNSVDPHWPDWCIKMLKGPLVDSAKVVLAAEIPIWADDRD